MVRNLAFITMVVMALPALAEEKPTAKHVGTWVREAPGVKITFQMNADATMKVLLDADGKRADVSCAYGVTKDGMLFGVMTKVDSEIGDGPEKGDLFGFTFSINGKEMTVSDLKGSRISDGAKKLVEGVFTKK